MNKEQVIFSIKMGALVGAGAVALFALYFAFTLRYVITTTHHFGTSGSSAITTEVDHTFINKDGIKFSY